MTVRDGVILGLAKDQVCQKSKINGSEFLRFAFAEEQILEYSECSCVLHGVSSSDERRRTVAVAAR